MMEKLSAAIAKLLPPELAAELRDHIRTVVQTNLEKMNLVTREQFDIQQKVLARTRARLQELEQQVAELERRAQMATNTTDTNA